MKKVVNLILVIVFILTVQIVARACLCAMTDAAKAFAAADAVFIGKVIKISNTKHASVGQVVKEAGTLELLKVPRWEKTLYPTRIVTLEVTEAFKGNVGKTFVLFSAPYDNGATCGVNFRMNESFLVYAHKRRLELSSDELDDPESDSKEIQLKREADKYNEHLPAFVTTICSRTERMRWAKDDVAIIRRILKTTDSSLPIIPEIPCAGSVSEDARRSARNRGVVRF